MKNIVKKKIFQLFINELIKVMIIKLDGITVEMTDTMFEIIKQYTQLAGMPESGGIILGGYIPNEKKYVFTEVSTPNSRDKRGPLHFVRNFEAAQDIIDKRWTESDGKINYLGEWHTHCCKYPRPSFTDKELLRMLISDKSNVWNELFMLILGVDNTFYLCMATEESGGQIVAEFSMKEG